MTIVLLVLFPGGCGRWSMPTPPDSYVPGRTFIDHGAFHYDYLGTWWGKPVYTPRSGATPARGEERP